MGPSSSIPLSRTNRSLSSLPFPLTLCSLFFFYSTPLSPTSCTHLTLLCSSSKQFEDVFLSLFAINFLFVLMEGATLGLLSGGGGGGSFRSSTNESTVSKVDVVEKDATSCPAESELELGLGLSLGVGGYGGGGDGKGKATAWGECGRIFTAVDFPSVLPHAHRGANASGSSGGAAVSGTKRAADSSPQEGGFPPGGRFES